MGRDTEDLASGPQLLETRSTRRLRVGTLAFIAALLPLVVLAIYHWDFPSLGAYHDDGVYLVTGKAFAEGKGYRIESLPDERWQAKYPPAFPLALAAVWRIFPRFPQNAAGFLLVAWLALPVLLLLQALMLARLEFRLASQVIACLCILAFPGALLLSVTLLSDLWFCCAALVAIALAERASEPGAHFKWAATAGVAAAIAYLTKSSGIVLLPSVALVMTLRGRWRSALVFCAVFSPAIAIWSGWSFTHVHPVADYNDIFYSSYFQEFAHKNAFAGLVPRIAARVSEFLLRLGSALIPEFLTGVVFDWLRRLVGVLGIAGIVRLCQMGRAWHYTAFAALYALEMCIWPSPLFPRYVLPVVPVWIAGFLTLAPYYRPGAMAARPKRPPVWGPLVTGLLAFSFLVQFVFAIHAASVWRSERRALEGAYAWIARSTSPTASVVAFRDPLLYLYTGHHAEGLHSSGGQDGVSRILHIAEFARRRGHRYILIGPKDPAFDVNPTRDAILDALQADRASLRVYSEGGADIYDVTAR